MKREIFIQFSDDGEKWINQGAYPRVDGPGPKYLRVILNWPEKSRCRITSAMKIPIEDMRWDSKT